MRKRQSIFIKAGLLALFVVPAFAQQPTPLAQATPETVTLKPVHSQLPTGNGVWVVHVLRTGGFAGISTELILTSDGKLNCASCKDQSISWTLSSDALRSATPSFTFSTSSTTEANVSLASLCNDCLSTRMTIQRRDFDGKIATYFGSWNDVTASTVPSEFVKLANTIISLAKK